MMNDFVSGHFDCDEMHVKTNIMVVQVISIDRFATNGLQLMADTNDNVNQRSNRLYV